MNQHTPEPAFAADTRLHIDPAYSPEDYQQPYTVTLGACAASKNWNPQTMPLSRFLVDLCKHRIGPKDGPAFVLADMVRGQKLKTAVKSLTGFAGDIDTGTPSAVVDQVLSGLGVLAVRYTTHSHGKTLTEFKRDKIVKFADGSEIDTDLIRAFLKEDQHWDESIVSGARYDGDRHPSGGLVVRVKHPEMPKHRVILPFATPFVVADEAPLQVDALRKWATVPEAIEKLLGLPFDRSCYSAEHMSFFPRCDENRPCEVSLFAGPLSDWRTLELDDPAGIAADIAKGKAKSVTAEGRELGRWLMQRGHGFQIVDVIRDLADARIRANKGNKIEIECPFDEDHNDAGNPDDRACMAVNAGDGISDWFTVSCRHESCRNKTMLDMLGRMLKDGWFSRDVLQNETYNIAIIEEDAEAKKEARNAKEREKRAAKKGQSVAKMDAAFVANKIILPDTIKRSEYGVIEPSYDNCRQLLAMSADTWGMSYDLLKDACVFRGDVMWPDHYGRELNAPLVLAQRDWMIEDFGVDFNKNDIHDSLFTLCRSRPFHPIRAYLEPLEWDGHPRVPDWLTRYCGVDENEYTRAVGMLWLVAGVRRVKSPGCKFDNVLCLEGEPGGGKSSVFKILGGEWFSEGSLGDIGGRYAGMSLQGVWIQELGEMAAATRARSLEEFKAFLSRWEDRYHAPHDRTFTTRPRQNIFGSNSNRNDFLDDPTGYRRAWPVKCEGFDFGGPIKEINLPALMRDRDQLWAEAAELEASNMSIMLPRELWAAAAKEQAARYVPHPWEDDLRDHLERLGDNKVFARDLYAHLGFDPKDRTRKLAKDVRSVMARLGWEPCDSLRIGSEVSTGFVHRATKANEKLEAELAAAM